MNEFQAWQKILYEWNKVQRMKSLNQRLYDQLGGSIIHILNYAEKHNIPLPNRDRMHRRITFLFSSVVAIFSPVFCCYHVLFLLVDYLETGLEYFTLILFYS